MRDKPKSASAKILTDQSFAQKFGGRKPDQQTNTTMSKYHRNAGKAWSPQEVQQLGKLAHENTPTRVIGLKLGRPVAGVYAKASEEGISLKPTNQHPYNRR